MKSESINGTFSELIRKNNSLLTYLTALNRGRNGTPRSWLYEQEDAEDVLQRWIPIMEAANKESPFGDEFNQFDLKQVEKFGQQGIIPPVNSKDVFEVLEPLFSPSEFDDEERLSEYFQAAHEFAKEAFGTRLQSDLPLGLHRVVDDMRARDTLTTNSGFPRFTKRNKVALLEIEDAFSGKAYDYPAIILFRHYNGKLRPVWMYPMSMNLIEFRYSQVIQDRLQNSPARWIRDYLSPWKGYEDVKETLTAQWPSARPIVGGDTTKMDANMRPAQIRLVYEIVKWLFPSRYWDDLYNSLMRVTNIPLLIGPDDQFIGTHGLASGSGWTQLTETVLQLFMAWNRKVIGQGIGDDFYWISDMDAKELVDWLGNFGLPANPSKQTVAEDYLTFLQRMNRQGFFSRESGSTLGAYYPTVRALNSLLWPEKFFKPKEWNSDMFCARVYMILENTVDNPCFDEFVKFVVHGQKDLIPFAKQSASEIDAAMEKARLVPGLSPSYNQEKREKPLSSYASIQLAATQ